MGAALGTLGRAAGKTFLGRGLVKAGSRGASKFKMPRMSIGAMRWAGTGSYRAIAEGAGESSASAVGRGAASGARSMRVPRFRATARQAAQAGEEGIEMSTFRSGGRALAQPTGLVSRTTGQSAFGRAGTAMRGALGRGRLPNKGLVGAGLGAVAATTIGVGASMRDDTGQDMRVNKINRPGGGGVESEMPEGPRGGNDKKPEERPPPRKQPNTNPTNPGKVPGRPPSNPQVPPKAGRQPGKYTPPPPSNPQPGKPPTRPPGKPPTRQPKAGRQPRTPPPPPLDPQFSLDSIRGGIMKRPGEYLRYREQIQPRVRGWIANRGYSLIRGNMLHNTGRYIRHERVPPRIPVP